MPVSQFIKYLVFSAAFTIVGFFALNIIIPLTAHLDVLWWSLLCYVVLAIVIHFLVEKSIAKQKGRNMISLVVFNVFLKLVFTFGFVSLYVKLVAPSDRLFLVPLLLTYLVFTIFETWFLNIQARDVS